MAYLVDDLKEERGHLTKMLRGEYGVEHLPLTFVLVACRNSSDIWHGFRMSVTHRGRSEDRVREEYAELCEGVHIYQCDHTHVRTTYMTGSSYISSSLINTECKALGS